MGIQIGVDVLKEVFLNSFIFGQSWIIYIGLILISTLFITRKTDAMRIVALPTAVGWYFAGIKPDAGITQIVMLILAILWITQLISIRQMGDAFEGIAKGELPIFKPVKQFEKLVNWRNVRAKESVRKHLEERKKMGIQGMPFFKGTKVRMQYSDMLKEEGAIINPTTGELEYKTLWGMTGEKLKKDGRYKQREEILDTLPKQPPQFWTASTPTETQRIFETLPKVDQQTIMDYTPRTRNRNVSYPHERGKHESIFKHLDRVATQQELEAINDRYNESKRKWQEAKYRKFVKPIEERTRERKGFSSLPRTEQTWDPRTEKKKKEYYSSTQAGLPYNYPGQRKKEKRYIKGEMPTSYGKPLFQPMKMKYFGERRKSKFISFDRNLKKKKNFMRRDDY